MLETPASLLPLLYLLLSPYTSYGAVNQREGNNLHASCPEMEISRSLTHQRERLFMIIVERVILTLSIRQGTIINFDTGEFEIVF